jgi:hypothetical protein
MFPDYSSLAVKIPINKKETNCTIYCVIGGKTLTPRRGE